MNNNRILITGGAGYIGSHTCKHLAQEGYECIVYDNLVSGHEHNVRWGQLVIGDIRDSEKLSRVFQEYKPAAVMHFAALAYVGESVLDPEIYYDNNVGGTLKLLAEMKKASVHRLVFSSTCATYGVPASLPIYEDTPQFPINPYGASKLMVERILEDYSRAYNLRYAALRYFNACGADPDGELAEEHNPETHLIPRCLMAASGLISEIEIFGNDYYTQDGTCIRDYIHVSDLAVGHVLALKFLENEKSSLKVNLGTGKGISVYEILKSIKKITGRDVPYSVRQRREGDPPALLADVSLAYNKIGFRTQYSDINTIIETAWRQFSAKCVL